MDSDDWLPISPLEPFTTATALDAGVSYRMLRELVGAGLLRRAVKGVYVGADVPDSPRLRADCLRLVVPPDCVVVDRHAGWLLGAEMALAPGEHLALRPLSLYRPSGAGRLRNVLCDSGERNLRPHDLTEVDGVRVTTALRTACDLGRVRHSAESISGVDAILRLRTTTRAEVVAEVERFRGMRWVTTLRAIAPLTDPRSESGPESVLRLRCHEVGLAVEPQVEIRREDRAFIGRFDLVSERLRLAIEYDGEEWHSTPKQLARDRARRSAAEEEGWRVAAYRKEHLFGPRRDVEDRLTALRLEAERRLRRTA